MPILSLQWSGSFNLTGVSFSAASLHQFLYFRWLCQFKWFFNEQTLLRFCSHLVDHFHHCSIKVYLSAIRSLHIDQGFPDPLVNCLQLQCPLQGIKRHQGSTLTQCQPVTPDHADYPAFLGYPQLGARHAVSCLLPRFLWIPKGWGVYGQPHL